MIKLLFTALFATAAVTGVWFNNHSSPASTKPSSETISLPTTTVAGNLADSRLNSFNNELVLVNKKVLKQTLDKSRVLYLNGEVRFDNMQQLSNDIKRLQAASHDPIYLLIDSPGGSVMDGATLIDVIESSKAPVNTVCVGLCASMAAMIHSFGANRYVTDRAVLMYHPASGGAQGQVPNMISQLTTINRYLEKMVANIVGRSKVSKEQYDKLVSYEFWIDGEDAVAKGLADSIVSLDVPNYPSQGPGSLPPPNESEEVLISRKTFNIEMISPHPELWTTRVRKN